MFRRNRSGFVVDPAEVEFQRLKTAVHEELVESLDLSVLGEMDQDLLAGEIRRLAEEICRRAGQAALRADAAAAAARAPGRDVRPGTAGKP